MPEDRSEAPPGEGSRGPATSEELELDKLSAYLADIAGQVARLARVRLARARLRVRRTAFLALGGILLALVAAALTLSGVRLFVRGLTAGLSELADGRVWLAELWSGILLLAGTAVVLVAVWSWSERRLLRGFFGRGEGGEDETRRSP